MVFLIQQTQNKDGLAIQLKLNELVAALEGASNRLINVEDLTAEELRDPARPLRAPGPAGQGSRGHEGVPLHRRGGAAPQEQGPPRQALTHRDWEAGQAPAPTRAVQNDSRISRTRGRVTASDSTVARSSSSSSQLSAAVTVAVRGRP